MTTLKVNVIRKPTIKVKVLPNFPPSVTATSPVLLSKVGGNYAFSLDINAVNTFVTGSLTIDGSQVTSGTLPAARLPNPTASTLGGIRSLAPVTSKWINTISTSGIPSATQPDALDVTFTQSGTGAVARTVRAKLRDTINAADFGVVADGVTNDTASLAAAILATPAGCTLQLPSGSMLISGSGNQIFSITTPINIIGAGSTPTGGGTTLLLATGVPSTRDMFHIIGVTNSTLRGYSFKNFNVGIASGTGGQHVFHFDTSAGTTTGFAEVEIYNVYMPPEVSAGGNSVFLNNNIGTNTNGGTFQFTIHGQCYIGGGLRFLKAGDTLRVLNNIITGANAGITSDQIAGAGQLIISGNNITSTGGCIIIANGVAPLITGNQCEQIIACTEANNAMIDLTGSVGNISNAKIYGNQIQCITGTATPIRVATATGTTIAHNRLATPSAYAHIVNTAAASATVLGNGNLFVGGGANIADSSTTVVYAPISRGSPLAVLGNISSTVTGPLADIVPTNINQVLVVDGSGSSIAWGRVQLTGGATSGVTGNLPSSQVAGTATNNSAAAGGIGEYQTAAVLIGAAVGLTTSTPANMTQLTSLSAGDWDISCVVYTTGNGAATMTQMEVAINTTSATLPTRGAAGGTGTSAGSNNFMNFTTPAGTNQTLISHPIRVSLASATTVFAVAQAIFTGGTIAAYGVIRARRLF